MKKKKTPGAPLGNQNNKKENPKTAKIEIRVTPEVKETLKEKADKEGLKLSQWVLKVLLDS